MTTTAERPALGQGVRAALDSAARAAADAGRDDLVATLRRQREQLDDDTFQVVVAGEFGRGKSALVNALVGAPVCGVSAQAATSVPTFVRYGDTPSAHLVPVARDDGGVEQQPVPVAVTDAARLTLRQHADLGVDGTGVHYGGVEIRLPRQLLRDGLVLVDTAGLGGGFAATTAAATLRALSGADAVLLVTDASTELSATELEFVHEAMALCPVGLCVMTKTDLYPHWRRLAELDRAHLAAAGVDVPLLPVSSVLRELAIDTGDPALLAECGFTVLVRALTDDLRRGRRAARCRTAASTAEAALQMVAGQLDAEHRSLTDPAGRERQLAELQEAERHAARLQGAAARWQELLADQVRALRRSVPRDLSDRFRDVHAEVRGRIHDGDPGKDWDELEPWLVRTTNHAVVAHHHAVLEQVTEAAAALAREFETQLDELPFQLVPVDTRRASLPTGPTSPRVSRVQVALLGARGFTLGGSVLGGLLTTAHLPVLAAFLTIAAPIAGVVAVAAGTAFAATSVRSMRQAHLNAARAEVERSIAVYLDETMREATRMDDDLVDTAFVHLRGHFAEQSARLLAGARASVVAAQAAQSLEGVAAEQRGEALRSQLAGVATLRQALVTALAAPTGAAR
jgi:hypothetical protein